MVLLTAMLVVGTLKTINDVNTNNQQLHLKEIKLRNTQAELEKLDQDYRLLQEDTTKTQEEKDAEIQRLKEREADLERQLQAKALLKAQQAKAYAESRPAAPTGVTNCGDNPYKAFIYQHESGCRTNAINSSSGACGIGQALPCSKLPCSLSDWACQDAWFTNYAMQRYGSWQNAYNFWLRNSWW